MLLPLDNVVVWKARAVPGERIIPPHLKLAILSRGRIVLPAASVKWLLELAVQNGATWPNRLKADLGEIFPNVPVTIELFLNQRPSLTQDQVDAALQAYLDLRHKQHLQNCHFLLFGWGTHAKRNVFEQLLGVDLTRLYSRPQVHVGRNQEHRYILLVYACIPPRITRFIAPESRTPPPPPAPAQAMPPLFGVTSAAAERTLRLAPTTSAQALGEQIGHVAAARVLDKADADGYLWYQIELLGDLPVTNNQQSTVIVAGTTCWVVSDGLDYIAAPWGFFRHQLIAFENANTGLGLNGRITRLRQMSHRRTLPFDTVIGSERGTVYLEDRSFVRNEWQILKDYQAVVAPDGRVVDIHHLLVGLDVLRHRERSVDYATIPIGTNYAAATWSGDLGSAAAEMTLRYGARWENRHPQATFGERVDYYFRSRAAEWDLLGDLDPWGIHALRAPERQTIDALLATYYEDTTPGGQRTLTTLRRDALERFLSHYGFSYDSVRDLLNYPMLAKQSAPARRIRSEIELFGRVWIFYRNPYSLLSRDEQDNWPAGDVTSAMLQQFLFWLEYTAIEHGAEVPPP